SPPPRLPSPSPPAPMNENTEREAAAPCEHEWVPSGIPWHNIHGEPVTLPSDQCRKCGLFWASARATLERLEGVDAPDPDEWLSYLD
ncbi:MAG TPA: hypothetical protein VD838_10890, partial [Anaeromyxobacteraceae bacterium]|nr:hypothetical protein [Anaeromyxobacteraceae bacterium]